MTFNTYFSMENERLNEESGKEMPWFIWNKKGTTAINYKAKLEHKLLLVIEIGK